MTEKQEKIRRAKVRLKAIERATKDQVKVLREAQRVFAKVSKRKMRPGGGKPKGGRHEHTVADMIQKAFAHKGVKAGDVYRTKNSGAGHKQKGDIGLSTQAAKYFPFTVEVKHYKKFNLNHLFVPYKEMSKKWHFREWWIQLKEECKISKKPGILIIRANGCKDLCAFKMHHIMKLTGLSYSQLVFVSFPHMTVDAVERIWVMRFDKFLILIGGKDGVYGNQGNTDRVRSSRAKP